METFAVVALIFLTSSSCCKLPNYDLRISQGSVVTVLAEMGKIINVYSTFPPDVACQILLQRLTPHRVIRKHILKVYLNHPPLQTLPFDILAFIKQQSCATSCLPPFLCKALSPCRYSIHVTQYLYEHVKLSVFMRSHLFINGKLGSLTVSAHILRILNRHDRGNT